MFNRIRQKLNRSLTSTGLNQAAGFLFRERHTNGVADIARAKGILVLKPDGIGDVILATGFFRSLRRQCPDARITIAVREPSRELVAYSCFCDEVMVWKEEWCGLAVKPKSALDLVQSARGKWQANPPDWVLIPRSGWDHANASLYAWWSGSGNVCAHEYFCNDRGMHRQGFVNHLVATGEMTHETEFHRRMLKFLRLEPEVAPRLELPAAASRRIEEFFLPGKIRNRKIALGIGASHDSKRWPPDNFKSLVQRINQKWPGTSTYLIGGAEDGGIARSILADAADAIVDATGKLSISETAALLGQCDVYVGNNSGPIHLAGASGCAVVEISKHPLGASSGHECSPVRFGPLARWSSVLQPKALAPECTAGCDKAAAHCITDITVNRVMDAISQGFSFAANGRQN